jgi:hypothetical protein
VINNILERVQKKFRGIVLLLLLIAIGSSCGKTRKSYVVKGEFRYYNKMDDTIQVLLYHGLNTVFQSIYVSPHDSLVLHTDGEDYKTVADPMGYRPGISADTTTIVFNDTLCYSEYHHNGPILHNISSYTYEKRGERDYVFFYDIDTSLLSLAVRCN